MPPEIKLSRRAMLDGVISIIEKSGWEAVSARSVAVELGISTQPLYREFGDMEGVKAAALERGFEIFGEYIGGDALDQAVRYVMFAAERGNLFNFLFRGRAGKFKGLSELSHSLIPTTDIINRLSEITSLTGEVVYELHLKLWLALHGMACFAADNGLTVTENEIKDFTLQTTRALTRYYKDKETK